MSGRNLAEPPTWVLPLTAGSGVSLRLILFFLFLSSATSLLHSPLSAFPFLLCCVLLLVLDGKGEGCA